jgi:hypothetical protein
MYGGRHRRVKTQNGGGLHDVLSSSPACNYIFESHKTGLNYSPEWEAIPDGLVKLLRKPFNKP